MLEPGSQSEMMPAAHVRFGSWPCKNSVVRLTRRNISKKLRSTESNHIAYARLGSLLENGIFYISSMYEFSHSQGHNRTTFFRDCTSAFANCGHAVAYVRGSYVPKAAEQSQQASPYSITS